MKAVIFLLVLSTLSSSLSATQWQDIKLVSEASPYKEIIEKFMANAPELDATNITARITNGELATLGQFPHQIYMYTYHLSGAGYLCGGSVCNLRILKRS